jgi:protease I
VRISAADFDAVIMRGGLRPPTGSAGTKQSFSLVRDAFHQGSVVASICHAAWVPISAGIVKG